jgi:hypothetical protein
MIDILISSVVNKNKLLQRTIDCRQISLHSFHKPQKTEKKRKEEKSIKRREKKQFSPSFNKEEKRTNLYFVMLSHQCWLSKHAKKEGSIKV